MNWNNIDLKSPYEASRPIMDEYTSETLLLEVSCNLREINRETVRAQAIESLKAKYNEALRILEDNLDNYVQHALKYRNS